MQQKVHHDASARARQFDVGDAVFVRNFNKGDTWLPGRITKHLSAVLSLIQGQSGQWFRRHQDDIWHRLDVDGDVAVTALPSAESTDVDSSVNESLVGPSPAISVETEPAEAQPPDNDSPLSTTSRYPSRNRSAPDRYQP